MRRFSITLASYGAILSIACALLHATVSPVLAASISVSPSSGPIGQTIIVSGTGFGTAGNVGVNLGANSDGGFNHGSTQLGSDGTFQVPMVVSDPIVAQFCTYVREGPSAGTGSCQVFVRVTGLSGTGQSNFTSTFTITPGTGNAASASVPAASNGSVPPPPPPAPPPVAPPVLPPAPPPQPPVAPAAVNCAGPAPSFPGTLQPGQSAMFVAGGFKPGSPVVLSMSGPSGGAALPATGANDSCQVSVSVTILSTDKAGIYTITATGTAQNGGAQTVTASFIVSAPAGSAASASNSGSASQGSTGSGAASGTGVTSPSPGGGSPAGGNPAATNPPVGQGGQPGSATAGGGTAGSDPMSDPPMSIGPLPDPAIGIGPLPGVPVVALGENGPFLLSGPPPSDFPLATVPPTVPIIRMLRDKLAADIELQDKILQDYRAAQKTALERIPTLEQLATLVEISVSSSGGISVDARQAYQAIYGTEAPPPRVVPGDRSGVFDPLRGDVPPTGTGASVNESSALTLSDLERVHTDLAAARRDAEQMPGIIKTAEDGLVAARQQLQTLDAWLSINEPQQ